MKRAFTLIEVTLALGILGVGILAIVGLYGFGYRESNQSREDVAATAVADYVLGQLTAAASATNVSWKAFAALKNYPEKQWASYLDSNSTAPSSDPTTKAAAAFNAFIEALGVKGMTFNFPDQSFGAEKLEYGLVILHEANSPIVSIGFRATKLRQMFLMVPVFYTEVMFQGMKE